MDSVCTYACNSHSIQIVGSVSLNKINDNCLQIYLSHYYVILLLLQLFDVLSLDLSTNFRHFSMLSANICSADVIFANSQQKGQIQE